VSESQTTGVAWRTGGLWTLRWLRIWFHLTSGRPMSFPPRGFVGRVSSLSAATEPRLYKLLSTRLHRVPFTHGARLWQLTCVWCLEMRSLPRRRRGLSLAKDGNLWGTVGEDDFGRPT